MKIGSPSDIPSPGGVGESAAARASRAGAPAVAQASGVTATDRVDVSAAAAQLGAFSTAEFDQSKVDAIREAIAAGQFHVNAGAIADRLIADAAALLSPRMG